MASILCPALGSRYKRDVDVLESPTQGREDAEGTGASYEERLRELMIKGAYVPRSHTVTKLQVVVLKSLNHQAVPEQNRTE